jgi:hypothetical protein
MKTGDKAAKGKNVMNKESLFAVLSGVAAAVNRCIVIIELPVSKELKDSK